MATPNVGILTNSGKNLIDQVNAGKTKITFSKIVFSSMNNNQLTDDQIKALTTIAPQEIVVNNPKVTLDNNTGETRIRATGNNEALTDGVYVKTYAVYAKDDSGNEILYGITVSPNPNYFPAYDGVTPQAVTYSYKTVIQETSNITMTNSNDVYVSQEDLTEAIAKIPQPDLSDYDKTDDVDKKLQNKQNKLDYTPANDANSFHLSPDTGAVTESGNFPGLKVQGVDVATAADLKSIEDSAWRPLKLFSSTSGTILFKDNGDRTASLTGSAMFNVAQDKDNFVAEVDAPDGYVFTSVDWKINIDSSTQIIGINSQYAISATGSSSWQALKVKIQDGNLLIGGSNNWNQNNLITFNAFTTNLKTVSLAGSPATIGITKLN